ncbi:zinc ribbon domain-containing protein [Diaphorobacter caeni]|uniref:zinc ribbon domain-containing protein n=1 Tax=Diaphorobacter caeni TaxID=2784387 RepID=UPI00188F5E8D|nr:zinc ribbon domain-containing protein [Diaphorobacter caeni]MBF5004527.1 zinc ribbon domain-containing protein [Diaphorobacter caeni]
MNCPACGHTLSPGARFCNKCGTLVSQVSANAATAAEVSSFSYADTAPAALEELTSQALDACPECGKALKPGIRFCTGCGTAIPVLGPAYAGVMGAAVLQGDEPVEVEVATASVEPAAAQQPITEEELDLALSFDDTRPPEIERSVLDSLPLHPVQRGMPDFELPVPREQVSLPDSASTSAPAAAPAPQPIDLRPSPEPVTFDHFGEAERQPGAGGAGGLKWLAIGVLALLVVGGGGWFGYKQFAGSGESSVPAAGAQPAQDDVAEGESVVPAAAAVESSATAMDSASQGAQAGQAATTELTPLTTATPADAAAPAVHESGSTTLAQPDATGAAAESRNPDQPEPVTVPPVHVLKDSPGSGAAPKAERKRNKSLDSLLD